jgi:uncharacterized RDD family membrane protein YckC/Tfp pilus assembly protein PilE
MFCEHCGKPVAPADRYCAACLTPRTPTPPLPTSLAPPPFQQAGPAPGWGAPASPPPSGPAGFWLRLAAMFIDSAVLGVVMGALVLGLAVVLGFAGATKGEAVQPLMVLAIAFGWVLVMAGQWAYFAFMECSASQATLGKMALGLVVTDLEGRRLGLGRASGRYFAKILSGIPLNLGYLLAAFTRRKQALHDFVAGTVVERRSEPRLPVLVIAVAAGAMPVVAIIGILAAIAIPNFMRYQLRSKASEAPVMLRALHAAELAHHVDHGQFMELEVPGGAPGPTRQDWTAEGRSAARELGWSAAGPTYFTYRVAVGQAEDGTQAFSTCAEADLDGDGVVAAWVTWQPVELPSGELVAPVPPCAHAPSLERPLELQGGDPIGQPVRVSPANVF